MTASTAADVLFWGPNSEVYSCAVVESSNVPSTDVEVMRAGLLGGSRSKSRCLWNHFFTVNAEHPMRFARKLHVTEDGSGRGSSPTKTRRNKAWSCASSLFSLFAWRAIDAPFGKSLFSIGPLCLRLCRLGWRVTTMTVLFER